MSNAQSVTKSALVPVIEAEALEFAKREGIEDVVRQLADATVRVYPTATAVRVVLKPDPELHDYWFVIFEVRIAKADVPDYMAAERRWAEEYHRCHPHPRRHPLVSQLLMEGE